MAQPEEVDPLTSQVALILTAAKQRKGLSFSELSERTGFARSAIVNWLSGERSPQIRDFYRLCAVLDIDPRQALSDASQAAGMGVTAGDQ